MKISFHVLTSDKKRKDLVSILVAFNNNFCLGLPFV